MEFYFTNTVGTPFSRDFKLTVHCPFLLNFRRIFIYIGSMTKLQ